MQEPDRGLRRTKASRRACRRAALRRPGSIRGSSRSGLLGEQRSRRPDHGLGRQGFEVVDLPRRPSGSIRKIRDGWSITPDGPTLAHMSQASITRATRSGGPGQEVPRLRVGPVDPGISGERLGRVAGRVERDRDELHAIGPRAPRPGAPGGPGPAGRSSSGRSRCTSCRRSSPGPPCPGASRARTAGPRVDQLDGRARGRCRPGTGPWAERDHRGQQQKPVISSGDPLLRVGPIQPSQLISMSWPRAGPVGSLLRSTLKNGSTFMPSTPTWTSRTQNRPGVVERREQRVGDVHPLAVARDVHHVRLDARRDAAEQLGTLGVAHVPLLDLVAAEAADEQVAVVGALAEVGRQGGGVGDLLELVGGRAVALAPEQPDRVVERAVGEAVVGPRLERPADLQRGQRRPWRPGAASAP